MLGYVVLSTFVLVVSKLLYYPEIAYMLLGFAVAEAYDFLGINCIILHLILAAIAVACYSRFWKPEFQRLLVQHILDDQQQRGTPQLCLGLEKLFLDGSHSDLVVRAEDQQFRVHKGILAARSAYFARRLTGADEMEEVGVPADVLREILRFVYSSRLGPLPPERLPEAYRAAIKYEMLPVQEMLQERMEDNLTTSMAIQYLLLAEEFKLKDLSESIVGFIACNYEVIKTKDEWKNLMRGRTEVAQKVIDRLARA